MQKNHKALFFQYVIPSIIAFALSGVYAIVDGYFVGNTIGDVGLSAINIAYPIVAVLQALGTGIGMGAAAATIIGLALTSNVSLVLINRFSAFYGGEKAIATYACVSYIICIIYLILQGVGDGSQPLMSRYYGEGDKSSLKETRRLAYIY